MRSTVEFAQAPNLAFEFAALRVALAMADASRDLASPSPPLGGAGGANVAQRAPRGRVASVFRELPSVVLRPSLARALELRWCHTGKREGGVAAATVATLPLAGAEPPRGTAARQKCLLSLATNGDLSRMADDSHENGTSNGDVPEIELIIKVSVPRAIANRAERDGQTGRQTR